MFRENLERKAKSVNEFSKLLFINQVGVVTQEHLLEKEFNVHNGEKHVTHILYGIVDSSRCLYK